MTTYSVALSANKQTDITVEEYGSGRPFLLLHGGAGPQSMMGFAPRLAASEHAHVYVPTHPGFGGTARPDWLNNIGALAETYIKLVEQLDLRDVTVVGGSIGGWIVAEMALRHSTRISSFILVDAVGIVVEGQRQGLGPAVEAGRISGLLALGPLSPQATSRSSRSWPNCLRSSFTLLA